MFFKKNLDKTENNFLIKSCALLIHAAKIDENYTEKEEEIIEETNEETPTKEVKTKVASKKTKKPKIDKIIN